jgi:hypothetical protein
MLTAFAAGCGETGPAPDMGLYVYCDGRADDLYYIHGLSQEIINYFSLPCLGPEFVSETGDTGSGEIDLDEWTNDKEGIDVLRTMCVAECLSYGGTECEQKNGKVWQIRNYEGKIVPDPLMKIIGGRVEYSAPDCDESTRPFYLANLALANTTETWALYSEDLKEEVYITGIAMQLRRPTLGVWNASTNEFYVGTERVEAYVSGTVQIGNSSPMEMGFLVANVEAIFGEIGPEHSITILDFIADDGGYLALEVDLDFDKVVAESLPIEELSP